ncbi:MAG TPA: signal peptidase I, partial [Luteolibacter sp.]|nr:signal peptidase I [Luteolibacter sp.]
WEKVARGRSYTRIVAKHDLELRVAPSTSKDVPLMTEVQDVQRFHFFSRSMLRTVDGEIIQLPAPANPIYHAGLSAALADAVAKQGPGRMTGVVRIPAGTVLCEGYIDTGDLVLVNKFAYHFRKPQRGEVFVFDTLGIHEIARQSGDQARGAHYIKRLCGIPGDSLSIQSPHLLVNGKIAREPGIVQVSDAKGPYAVNPQGYISASAFDRFTPQLKLRDEAAPGLREYAALGDNTDNSLDSRYWGSVKEFNLVGPALFSLWPFTTGHWGFIR